ncbi:hypothetical protein [Nitrosomonas ureae]|nr:hypothetical protein [Nitrosomonas ureae]
MYAAYEALVLDKQQSRSCFDPLTGSNRCVATIARWRKVGSESGN